MKSVLCAAVQRCTHVAELVCGDVSAGATIYLLLHKFTSTNLPHGRILLREIPSRHVEVGGNGVLEVVLDVSRLAAKRTMES